MNKETLKITPFGNSFTTYGYIENTKFVYVNIDKEFELEGGAVVEFKSLQTGGMVMVDYVEMQDETIYALNDEIIVKYTNKESFVKEFEEQEIDFYEAEEQGLLISISLDDCKERNEIEKDEKRESHKKWVLGLKLETDNKE